MSRTNSSTSGSEPGGGRGRGGAKVLLFAALWLVVFDLLIGQRFPLPREANLPLGKLRRYFSLGQSIEGKVRTMVQPDDAHSAWIAPEGWLDSMPLTPQPTAASGPGQTLVAVYGQSFAKYMAQAIPEIDPHFEVRMMQAPSAPLNHSVAVYQRDRQRQTAQVVVIGVLASVLPELVTMTPMTSGFEFPYTYTYPRYTLAAGQLVEHRPGIDSLPALRAALADRGRWNAFRAALAAHDEAFDAWTFDQGVMDWSVIGRLIRRALGQRHQRLFAARFHGREGFRNEAGLLDVAEALLAEFARSAHQDGRLPYVILFNDLGYSDHLTRALGPRLEKHGIAYLSNDQDAPADDPSSFAIDHYRPELYRRMAARWLADVGRRLAHPPASAP